jgi:hypothetical protein
MAADAAFTDVATSLIRSGVVPLLVVHYDVAAGEEGRRLALPFLADTKAFLDMIRRATGLLARAAPFNVDALLLEHSTGRAAAYPRNTRNSNDVSPMDLVLAFSLLHQGLSQGVQGHYGYSSKNGFATALKVAQFPYAKAQV